MGQKVCHGRAAAELLAGCLGPPTNLGSLKGISARWVGARGSFQRFIWNLGSGKPRAALKRLSLSAVSEADHSVHALPEDCILELLRVNAGVAEAAGLWRGCGVQEQKVGLVVASGSCFWASLCAAGSPGPAARLELSDSATLPILW